jgi:hypothetical protein
MRVGYVRVSTVDQNTVHHRLRRGVTTRCLYELRVARRVAAPEGHSSPDALQ